MWGRAEYPGRSRNAKLWLWTLPHGSISARPGKIFDKGHSCVCWQEHRDTARDVPTSLPTAVSISWDLPRQDLEREARPAEAALLRVLERPCSRAGGTSCKRGTQTCPEGWGREWLGQGMAGVGPLRAPLLPVPSRAFPAGMRGSLVPGSSGKRH